MSDRSIRNRHTKEKKKIVPDDVDLVSTHPFADRIKKAQFKAKLEGKGHDPVSRIQDMRSDYKTVMSQMYTALKSNYWDLGGVCQTEAELDEHLDWMFEQVYVYAEKTKDLMRKHRTELLKIKQARRIKNGQ